MTRAISLRHRGLVHVTYAISNELQRQAERERFGPVYFIFFMARVAPIFFVLVV